MKFESKAIDMNRYYDSDRFMTIFWNTLSMKFPKGEQFFVKSVLHYKNRIKDASPELYADLDGFIRQEAQHTKAHIDFNNALKSHGYPTEEVDALLDKFLLPVLKKYPLLALHITAILEHYTSILGIQLLDEYSHREAIQGEARKIWLHHAVEEFEHRTVSFDVLSKVGGKHTELARLFLFAPVSIGFAGAVAATFAYNLKRQGIKKEEMASIVRLIDLLLKNKEKIADWYTTGFHPSQHYSKHVEEVKAELGIT